MGSGTARMGLRSMLRVGALGRAHARTPSRLCTISAAVMLTVGGLSLPAQAMSLRDAVQQAVSSHPAVDAARAERRATGHDLREAQGTLYPSLDLQADAGQQWIDRPESLDPTQNQRWRPRRQAVLTMRQVLFNGYQRANQIYRSAALLDAAALRVLSRAEVLALDAVEAYIDYRRHSRLLELGRQNVARHREILSLVEDLVRGGKAPASDADQTRERVAAAESVTAQIEQAFLEARAKFRKVIGVHPSATQPVGYPSPLPRSVQAAISEGLSNNPGLKAASASTDAFRAELDATRGTRAPTLSLEGSATVANDINGTNDRNNDVSGRVVLNWNLFDGHIRKSRISAASERLTRAQLEYDSQARDVTEAIERAFAAYLAGGKRLRALREQVAANAKVVAAYEEEYQLGKRSLLDLLDGENANFNSRFQFQSAAAIHYFSAYQLLAHMGRLLDALGVSAPIEVIADHRIQSERSLFRIEIEPLRRD
jgi:adhesin transport system outer membrane protein